MGDIVAAVGTTRGALYWHFANKEAFLLALLQRAAKLRTKATVDAFEMKGPADQLLANFLYLDAEQNARLSWVNRLAITVGLDAHNISPEVGAVLRRQMAVNRYFFSRLVRYGQVQGTFRSDLDPDETGALIYAARLGILTGFYLDPQNLEIRRLAQALVRTLVPGLLCSAKRPATIRLRRRQAKSKEAAMANLLRSLELPSEAPLHPKHLRGGDQRAISRTKSRANN